MEFDWGEVHRLQLPPPESNGIHSSSVAIGTLAFDTQQELLWVGNECGRITSFYGPELTRYTSLRAHPTTDGPVLQFLFHEKGVISLASNSVHSCSRRGLTQWHISDFSMINLCCMSFLGRDSSEIVVAGCQGIMYKIDIEKGQITEEISTNYEYTLMKFCHYVCAGTNTGIVNFLDPETLMIIKSWQAHTASINDMDAQNNYLVTCGWSTRPNGLPMLDILAKVFDLRKLEQLPPIPFPGGAAFVQMHPKMSTTSVVASQSGQLQVVDLMNPNTSHLHQANLSSYMLNLTLAPSGAAWALTDQENSVHLWGSHKKLQFAEYTNITEFADEVAQLPLMNLNTNLPFNTVGMPRYREKLLSTWPAHHAYEVGYLPAKIDPEVLKTMLQANIGYRATNPRKGLRNQFHRAKLVDSNGTSMAVPKFLSEKAREAEIHQVEGRRISDTTEFLANLATATNTKAEVPIVYRNVEIKYSKFGVDDFDFQYYNNTQYSGLETHITNSYLNSLLQLFKFTPLIRNLALYHAASSCIADGCLFCEMGFLFDMLEKADGLSCQATNFLKAFSNNPEASRLQTLEENSPQNTLEARIQAANRFLLDQIAFDSRRVSPNDAKLDQTLATVVFPSISCIHCKSETARTASPLSHDLIYPPLNLNSRLRNTVPTFSDILQFSIERETQIRAWCDKCRRYRQLATTTTVHSIPPVLVFNTGLDKSLESKQLWAIPGWLPEEIGISIEQGKIICFEGETLQKLRKIQHQRNIAVYQLVGMVADINSGERERSHLVSLVDVAISGGKSLQQSQWHLFNDFLVRRLPTESALHLSPTWKMPVILTYQNSSARHAIDNHWKEQLDTSCLYYGWSMKINSISPTSPTPGIPLRPTTEAPTPGSPVAIDSEFVALRAEEIEISAAGDRQVIRPTRLGLARVSVLRGSGPLEAVPFINDYITIVEPVVDYLTKYSGLKAGDLDPRLSTHALVSLKVAYKKLWILLNLGVVFVGHGLPKDFRTINIHVPKAQVLDTVDLFYIRARQRKLSLRFLAWYLLKEDIQQETHDSIEDARTALRLWRKYEQFRTEGVIEKRIEEIYRDGRKWGFKPPGEMGGSTSNNGSTGLDGHSKSGEGLASRGESGGLGSDSGRETPTLPLVSVAPAGISGRSTPVGRRDTSRESEYFESPLR